MDEKERKYFFKRRNLPTGTILNIFHLSFIQVSNAALQILLFPLIIRLTGLQAFGHVMVASSFAGLLGIFINYGTNQSGIKDIALFRDNPVILSQKFYSIIFIRLFLFTACLTFIPFVKIFTPNYFIFILYATPMVLAEVFNPIFFYIGIEKLLIYNLTNLFSKLTSFLLIILFISGKENAYLVNFYLGICTLTIYFFLFIYASQRYRIAFYMPNLKSLWNFGRNNAHLTGNNLSVHLQQSIFLFILSASGSTLALGAYAFCDKIIWAFRLLLISFSSAIFPRFTLLYEENLIKWKLYKQNINWVFFAIFIVSAVIFLLFPNLIVIIFTGEKNSLGSTYVRAIAFAPLIIALNSLNLLELLIRNAYASIFRISLVVLSISIVTSLLLVKMGEPSYFAYYPLLIETSCLILYLFYLKKNNNYSTNLSI